MPKLKKKRKYWAVGDNFWYSIVTDQPNSRDLGSISGPFNTLKEAKKQAIEWIQNDREHLQTQLHSIKNFKIFKKDK